MTVTGVFGGTFDPVHYGHLHSARELLQRAPLDALHMLPCHLPPHRQQPGCSSEQRLAMLRLACADTELQVDDRELRRSGPSYSVDTLQQIRAEIGAQASLVWVMGSDAFAALDSWHQWQRLPTLAHIVVMARPGEALPTEGAVAELLAARRGDDPALLGREACGRIVPLALTPYPISATDIRRRLKKGLPVDELMPPAVVNYIRQHHLYR